MLFSPLCEIVFGDRSWLPFAVGSAIILILATLVRNYRERSSALGILATILKICGVLLLAACLIEPLFRGVRPRPGANAFVILADDSQSMTVNSGSDVRSTSLKTTLSKENPWRVRLEQDFDVREYRFDEQLRHIDDPEELTFAGIGSRLHSSLQALHTRFQSRPMAGVLVFSDGNATDQVIDQEFDFPIYVVVDDDSAEMRDVRIKQMQVSETNFEMSPTSINAVVATDGLQGKNLTAQIIDVNGKRIRQQQADVDAEGNAEFKFRFRPESTGLSFHQLQVFATDERASFEQAIEGTETPSNELTFANNRRWLTTDRGGGPYRVLYVSGRPNWEFKFLRRALDKDDEVELRGLIRIAKKQPKFAFQDRSGVSSDRNQLFDGFEDEDEEDLETYDQTVFIRIGVDNDEELVDGFPKDADTLFGYHALILDDVESKFFNSEQMLLMRRFVNQRGGGLLMLSGLESFIEGGYEKTPMSEVLPVYLRKRRDSDVAKLLRNSDNSDFEGLRWDLTREGWLQDWTRLRASEVAERKRHAELPAFKVISNVSGLKPGASLLATANAEGGGTAPLMASHRFGKGRSAAILAGDMWKWHTYAEDPQEQDLQQLWRQIVRWLVAEVPMRVRISTEESKTAGSNVGGRTIRVAVRDEQFLAQDNAEVRLEVSTPGGEKIELTAEPAEEAGEYSADYWPREDGPYRVTAMVTTVTGEDLPGKEAGWTTQRAADEFQQLTTNREVLQELAQRSGGEVIQVSDLSNFVASLPSRKVPVTENWTYPLWHQPWVLVLAMVCLCGEWGLRRWRGLA